jgi:hypothetical protein
VLVHRFDYGEDRVLASINGQGAEWCSLTEEYMENGAENWKWDFTWDSSSFLSAK